MKVKPIIINISIRNKLEVFMPQVLCAVERLDGFLYFSLEFDRHLTVQTVLGKNKFKKN